jgi:DNA repair ATPase RecN
MFIYRLRVKNFKCFSDKTFEFSSTNFLKGKNGAGKTSIRDAIIFALYNRTPDGSRDTERYIQKGQDFCEVELTTDKHVYFRKKSKSQSEFRIDDELTTQKETEIVSFDFFASVFNVGYFMNLNEKEQRDLILTNTSSINRLELFRKLGGKEAYLGSRVDLSDIAETLKKVNAKKLLLTKNKDYSSAQLEYLKEFPFDKLKLSKATLVKVQDLIERDKNRLSLACDSATFSISEMKNTYRVLVKLPFEEIKLKLSDLLTKLQKEFNNVEIVLSELYKNEMGYQDTFKFKINGLDYQALSTGEKLRFDLVISKFFNSLLKEPIDCFFVDNTSVLDEDISVPDQSFITQIWPYDLELIAKVDLHNQKINQSC